LHTMWEVFWGNRDLGDLSGVGGFWVIAIGNTGAT